MSLEQVLSGRGLTNERTDARETPAKRRLPEQPTGTWAFTGYLPSRASRGSKYLSFRFLGSYRSVLLHGSTHLAVPGTARPRHSTKEVPKHTTKDTRQTPERV